MRWLICPWLDDSVERAGEACQKLLDIDYIIWADPRLIYFFHLALAAGNALLELTHIHDEHRRAATRIAMGREDAAITDELDEVNCIGAKWLLACWTDDLAANTLDDLEWVVIAHKLFLKR